MTWGAQAGIEPPGIEGLALDHRRQLEAAQQEVDRIPADATAAVHCHPLAGADPA